MESKTHSGYRKRMYQDACSHGALFDIREPQPSNWYPQLSNDLHISLMFDNKKDAVKILNCLAEYNIGAASLFRGKLEVNKEVVELNVDQEGVFVLFEDYVHADNNSPSNTSCSVKSPTEFLAVDDPVQEMRSLEKVNEMPAGDTLFKCHIAPQGFFPDYAKDKDNIIFGSHLFHIYFDGDGKRKPTGSNIDWGKRPRFKMAFESSDLACKHQYGIAYHKICVRIIFEDPRMAREMEGRWREGAQTVGDLEFRSHFYTTNVENCKKYIRLKKRRPKCVGMCSKQRKNLKQRKKLNQRKNCE